MDIEDKNKIKKIIRDRKKSHNYFSNVSDVYKSFIKMEEKTFNNKTLEKKHKELIAIGISIVINCESCLEWHIHEALKSGAEQNQIIEAIEVGMEMGGGPATVSARFAHKILEYYNEINND